MVRLAILASHEGTTLQALIDACAEQRLDAQLVAVISNNSASGALRRAKLAGIPTHQEDADQRHSVFFDLSLHQ